MIKKPAILLLIIFAFVISLNETAQSQACCGRVTLPTSGIEQRPLLKNQFEIRLDYENSYMGKTLLDSESIDDPLSRNNRTNVISISATYGITERLSAVMAVPFKWTRLSILEDRVIRKTSGIGDIVILSKFRLFAPVSPRMPEFALGLGIKIPTGDYDQSDYFGVMSASQQVGTGAFDFLASAHYSQLISDFNIFSSVIFRMPTKNDRGYKFGNEFEMRVATQYIGLSEYVTPNLGVHARLSARSEYDGSPLNSYGGGAYRDSGGEWIYINSGFEIRPIKSMGFNFELSIPVYNRVNGRQISETITLRLATSFSRL